MHRHSVRASWPQPLQCDSQPVTTIALQITMAVTHRTAGGPAATTRAAAPSGGSGYCACHCRERGAQRRPRAPQALLQSLDTAERAGVSDTMEITMAVVHRHSVRTSWPQPLQCDSQPVTTIALQSQWQ